MKKLLTTICLMFTPVFASAGTAFEDDPTNYFVSGAGANEALEMVNEIICFFKNTRSEKFVNDGPYKATVYADECETVSSDSSSGDAAKPQQSSASSTSTQQGETAEQKTGSTAILNVTRGDDENDPVITKGWFALVLQEEMGPGESMEMNIDVFIDMVQTAGVSEDNPKGEWQMRYSLAAGKDMQMCSDCPTIPKGTDFGLGYIDSAGKTLRFKDNGMQGNANVIANFDPSGDIEGIYMEEVWMGGDMGGDMGGHPGGNMGGDMGSNRAVTSKRNQQQGGDQQQAGNQQQGGDQQQGVISNKAVTSSKR